LVPTLEKYEQIMDMPLSGGVPYRHFEQHASISTLSSITKILEDMLKGRLVVVKDTRGFLRGF